MLDKALNIPESILEKFHCSSCNGYLSCGPVRVLPDGSSICGRCTPLTNDAPIYRVLAFEAILNNILFPCRFNRRGCEATLGFGHAIEHESQCTYRTFACPLACNWEGSSEEIPPHFKIIHPELIVQDVRFKIILGEELGGVLMLLNKDNGGFVLKYHYDAVNIVRYELGYCRNELVCSCDFKIQLINDSDPDCNVGLKAVRCKPFNESFYNLQNPNELCLSNYLQNLDNPGRIVIKFGLVQNAPTPIDLDVLKKLRCELCYNYLIPPLYELNNRAICCDCSKTHPNCVPLNNTKIKRLVCEAKFPCRWRDCKFIGKSEDYKLHEFNCRNRYYDCFFPSCKVTFKLASAIEHLQNHRAQYLPKQIAYKTDFSQTYTIKHIFTIRDSKIVIIQHSMIGLDSEQAYVHRVALFSSDPGEIVGNIEFEHEHCKLKSKPFMVVSKYNTDVALSELPFCFKSNDELTVNVNV